MDMKKTEAMRQRETVIDFSIGKGNPEYDRMEQNLEQIRQELFTSLDAGGRSLLTRYEDLREEMDGILIEESLRAGASLLLEGCGPESALVLDYLQ